MHLLTRTIRLTLLSTIALLPCFSQTVLNAGFEQGALGPWVPWYNSGTGNSISVGGVPHSGSFGLIQTGSNQNQCVFQDISGLNPGQQYLVSAWVAASSVVTNGAMLWLHDVQGGNSVQLGITPTTNWQQVSLPYTVDSTGKLRIHLYQFAGSETTYWDEVALTPVPPVNPGFETGSLGAWKIYNGGSGAVGIGSVAHSGSYGVTESPNGGANSAVYQDITRLQPGQTYIVSAWARSSSSPSAPMTLAMDDGLTCASCASTRTIAPTTTWQRITQTYTVSASRTMRVYLFHNPGSSPQTTTYWDDVTINPMPPANAGFETGALTPWIPYQGGPTGGVTVTATGHSGSYSLMQSPNQAPNNADEAAFQDIYGLTPGQSYTVSVWVKSSSTTTGTVRLAMHDTLGGNWQTLVFTPTTSWQQISQTYTVTSNGAMRIHLYQSAGPETTYWDDVTVTAAGATWNAANVNMALWEDDTRSGQSWTCTTCTDPALNALSPAHPAKENIYFGGQLVVSENQ